MTSWSLKFLVKTPLDCVGFTCAIAPFEQGNDGSSSNESDGEKELEGAAIGVCDGTAGWVGGGVAISGDGGAGVISGDRCAGGETEGAGGAGGDIGGGGGGCCQGQCAHPALHSTGLYHVRGTMFRGLATITSWWMGETVLCSLWHSHFNEQVFLSMGCVPLLRCISTWGWLGLTNTSRSWTCELFPLYSWPVICILRLIDICGKYYWQLRWAVEFAVYRLGTSEHRRKQLGKTSRRCVCWCMTSICRYTMPIMP